MSHQDIATAHTSLVTCQKLLHLEWILQIYSLDLAASLLYFFFWVIYVFTSNEEVNNQLNQFFASNLQIKTHFQNYSNNLDVCIDVLKYKSKCL